MFPESAIGVLEIPVYVQYVDDIAYLFDVLPVASFGLAEFFLGIFLLGDVSHHDQMAARPIISVNQRRNIEGEDPCRIPLDRQFKVLHRAEHPDASPTAATTQRPIPRLCRCTHPLPQGTAAPPGSGQ